MRLDHVVIAVSDFERSNAFYRDVLGAEIVEIDDRVAYRVGGQQLNVHGPGTHPGWSRECRSPLGTATSASNGRARSTERSSTCGRAASELRPADDARRGEGPRDERVLP